jgi:predicted HAD superfamily Cof-like phosphohydrolase
VSFGGRRIMTNFERVKEFHKTMGLDWRDTPGWILQTQEHLRVRLILEELSELSKAYAEGAFLEVADALADLLYVVYGTAVEHGIDIDKVFKEIHRSNMTKKGGHLDASGKWIKPDNYEPPNLNFLLENQNEIQDMGHMP